MVEGPVSSSVVTAESSSAPSLPLKVDCSTTFPSPFSMLGYVRVYLPGRAQLPTQFLHRYPHRGFGVVRQLSGEHLVQNDPRLTVQSGVDLAGDPVRQPRHGFELLEGG